MSRDRNPDPYNVRLIVNLLETKGIFTPLVTLEQKRCPRLPDEINDWYFQYFFLKIILRNWSKKWFTDENSIYNE